MHRADLPLAPRHIRAIGAVLLVALLAPTSAHAVSTVPALTLSYPVAAGPFALAGGDLNGDGVRDIVVANSVAGSVSVMLGTAQLGFGPRTDYPSVGGPNEIALADFNGDGRLDMAVATGVGQTMSVRLGNGVGGFGPATNYATQSAARGIASGDLNRDGHPDVVVANLYTSTVSVFLGDGIGGFAPRVDWAAGSGPAAVAVGDFNQDDIPDLAVANFFGNTVTLLSGTATGTSFTTFATVNVPTNPIAILLTDVDGNGILDAVTCNYGAASATVIPITGTGVGTPASYNVGTLPSDVAAAVNRFGQTTLFVSNGQTQSVSALTFNSAGGLLSTSEYASFFDPSAVLAHDADGDGELDIVVANHGSTAVQLIKTVGDSLYKGPDPYLEWGVNKAMADFDLDGDLDFAGAGNGVASTRFGNGAGSFGPKQFSSAPPDIRQIASADMDGDGFEDLVMTYPGGQLVTVHRNMGTGVFAFAYSQTTAVWPTRLAVADLNHDSHPDVVASCEVGNVISVMFNNGLGAPGARTDYPVGNGPTAIALGHFNHDNNETPDIVVTNQASNTISVLLSDPAGSAQYGLRTDYNVGTAPRTVGTGDLNGDGNIDIVVGNQTSNNFSILLGNGLGGFAAAVTHAASGAPNVLSLADVNGDGRLDIVAGLSSGTGIYLGDGVGGFGPRTLIGTTAVASNAITRDFSGDGRLDVMNDYEPSGVSTFYLGRTWVHLALTAAPLAIEGQPVTLTANLTWAGAVAPSGNVRFFDGTTLLGTATVSNGVAAVVLFASLSGDRSLSAVYQGGGRFAGAFSNVVKQRVVPTAKPSIASIKDIKGDQGGRVRLKFNASPFDYLGSTTPITSYSVYRQVGAFAAQAALRRTAIVSTPARVASPDAIAIAGWDYVTTVPANAETIYETVVETLADSNGTGVHNAALFVRAATATPGVFYDSAPDSGHSVDNLPPVAPAPFLASYVGGATYLHWLPNTEPDLWYYTLHRGTGTGFTPDAGNRIATPGDTGHVDAGAAGGYYKLAAVDVNGNVSGYTLLTPQATTDVGEGGSLAFALEGARPNPARGGRLSVAFTLPSADPARLELIDLAGRVIAAREVGTLGAGRHVVDVGRNTRLAAGVYVLRVTQGGASRSVRATVLE